MTNEFGEFVEEESAPGKEEGELFGDEQGIPVRVRTPKKGEVIGVVVQRFGGSRMEVHSVDGKKRNCRIPGRYKKFLWLRPKDIVLITPWADDDSKGDVIFKYSPSAVGQLRRKGVLDSIKDDF